MYDMTGVHGLSGTEKPDGSGYQVRVPLETDGYNSVLVYPGSSEEQMDNAQALMLFNGESGADTFAAYLRKNGIDIGWHYAESSLTHNRKTAPSSSGRGSLSFMR